MGSDLRFDYSVLGDSLASRLEGQSKERRWSAAPCPGQMIKRRMK
jgi:hypothetical protein